jgi:TonB-linked SusC/RagA family outer membrane protein
MKKSLLIFSLVMFITGPILAQVTITGMVKDKSGEPLPGVNIIIKGTKQGTTTDVNGHYTISDVPAEGVLVFSYVGMTEQEITVGTQTQINVTLEEEVTNLNEVVVIGYGDVKRSNLVGSVVDIAADDIEELPAANLSTLLEGRLAGVRVSQSSGKPGSSTSVEIRTSSSWNNEEPIFVIDGIIYDEQNGGQERFDVLDPTEIESISVLKDASAAVYGARGAGGAIIVKTKRGKIGRPKIQYSGTYGISDATQFPDMMSAYEQAVFVNDAIKIIDPDRYESDPGYYTEDELEYFKTIDHNWLEQAWQKSHLTRHTLNVSGGNDRLSYYGGGSYYYETGNFKNLYTQKYTLRMGLDANITKNITASFGISIDNRNNQRPYNEFDKESDPLRGTFKALLQTPRWIPSYSAGLPVGQRGLVDNHPLEVEKIDAYSRSNDSHYNLNSALEYRIPWVQGLKMRFAYSYNQGNTYGKQYRVPYYLYDFTTEGGHRHIITDEVHGDPTYIENGDQIQESSDIDKSYQVNGSISWARKLGAHDIKALFVYEQSESESHGFNSQRENMVIPTYDRQEGFSETVQRTRSSAANGARLSYIGRLNYIFSEKYILESAFRYEGSVKFPPETRWGFFPSISVGWRISEESFFKDNINFITYLKLRASAGLVGNDKVVARQWEQSYSPTSGAYLGGSSLTNAVEPRNSGVTLYGVTWEKSDSYNGGIDMRIVNNISLAFDAFYRYTYDILNERRSELPTSTGINNMPKENFGKMSAWGWEIDAGYDLDIWSNFNIHFGGNISFSRAKVIEKFQNPAVRGTWADEIGKMPNGEVGYFATGIIRTQEEADSLNAIGWTIFGDPCAPGMVNYKDMGSADYSDSLDGRIDGNDKRILEPYASAPYNYGFIIGTLWKGIKFSANFAGSFGHKLYMEKEAFILPPNESRDIEDLDNLPAFWTDHWTPENPDAAYPRAYQNGAHQRSTFWERPGHILRVSSLTLAYTLPNKVSEKVNIRTFSIVLTARNLWTIINPFDYKDPNLAKFNGYPLLRTINVGVNLTL